MEEVFKFIKAKRQDENECFCKLFMCTLFKKTLLLEVHAAFFRGDSAFGLKVPDRWSVALAWLWRNVHFCGALA